MSSAVKGSNLDILDLEPLEVNLFRGRSPQVGWQRVFGGQVIGQALVAAVRTVEGVRPPHSLHAYFLLPGDPKVPIIYDVDRIRDGKSFTTRRVTARQHGRSDLLDAGVISYEMSQASTTRRRCRTCRRQKLPSDTDMLARSLLPIMPDPVRRYYERERPVNPCGGSSSSAISARISRRAIQCLDPYHRQTAGSSRHSSMRAGLCVGHDAPRYGARAPHGRTLVRK